MSVTIEKAVRVTMKLTADELADALTVEDLADVFAGLSGERQVEFFRILADRADALGMSAEELAAVRVLAQMPVAS